MPLGAARDDAGHGGAVLLARVAGLGGGRGISVGGCWYGRVLDANADVETVVETAFWEGRGGVVSKVGLSLSGCGE